MSSTTGVDAKVVLVASVLGLAKTLIIIAIGAFCAYFPRGAPLLTKGFMQSTSRLSNLLFLPALVIASIGSTLTPEAIAGSWHLLVANFFTHIISWFVAGVVGRIFLGRDRLAAFRPVRVAITFPNCVGLPLLLMESLCEQGIVNSDFEDGEECLSRATGMIFVYGVGWQVCFFSWGFFVLGESTSLEATLPGTSEGSAARNHTPTSPPLSLRDTPPACKKSESFTVVAPSEQVGPEDPTERDVCPPLIICPGGASLVTLTPTSLQQPLPQINQQQKGAESGFSAPSDRSEGTGRTGGVLTEAEISGKLERTGLSEEPCLQADQGSRSSGIKRVSFVRDESESKVDGIDEADRVPSNAWQGRNWHGTALCMEASGQGGVTSLLAWKERGRKITMDVLLSPNMVAVFLAVVVVMVPSLQRMLFHNPTAVLRPLGAAIQTLGTPVVAVQAVVMAGSLAQRIPQGVEGVHGSRGEEKRKQGAMGFVLVVCRLIVVPTVGFGLFWLARGHFSLLGNNRLMDLVLLLELCMPSAQLIIVSLNHLNLPVTTGFVARLYLVQYLVSMVTCTLWIALAVYIVYK